MTKINVTICGEGNATHVMIAHLGSHGGCHLRVLGMQRGEELQTALDKNDHKITCENPDGSLITGTVDKFSTDPADVIPGSQLILIPLPVFAHEPFLKAIKDHLDDGVAVGVLPGQGGTKWLAKKILGDKFKKIVFFGTDRLPYNCRIQEFGKSVHLFGLKEKLGIASLPAEKSGEVADLITKAYNGVVTGNDYGSILNVTLLPVNQVIHPSRIFALFKDWDGKTPYKKNPLFYEEMDEYSTGVMKGIDDDIQNMADALNKNNIEVDIPRIHPMLVSWYDPKMIGDASTLCSYFKTNEGYAGIGTPMKEVEGGYIPDWTIRYLHEDVPYGLCVVKGIATMLDLKTPNVDELIKWCQERMEKEYITKDGKFEGKDIVDTNAPQAFGFHDLKHLK